MTQLLPGGYRVQDVQGLAQSSSPPGPGVAVPCDADMGQLVVRKVFNILGLWSEIECLGIPLLPL